MSKQQKQKENVTHNTTNNKIIIKNKTNKT